MHSPLITSKALFSVPSTGNVDQSYDRENAGGGACQDSDSDADDFFLRAPSDPQDSTSGRASVHQCNARADQHAHSLADGDVLGPTPTPTTWPLRSVVINEVGWAGTGASASDEWIELYHPGSGTVYLEGWELVGVRAGGVIQFDIIFEDTQRSIISIGPNSYLVLTANDTAITTAPVQPTWTLDDATFGLIDTGMTLYLYDPSGPPVYVDSANRKSGGRRGRVAGGQHVSAAKHGAHQFPARRTARRTGPRSVERRRHRPGQRMPMGIPRMARRDEPIRF